MTSTQLRPTRRTLVRGAAWSVPVVSIAAAAPAFAASLCRARSEQWRLDWGTSAYTVAKPSLDGTHTGTATVTGSATFPTHTNSTPVVVTFSSTMTRANNAARRADGNLTVSDDTNIGNLGDGERALNIAHNVGIRSGRANYRQEIQISFDRPITNLAFTVTDIDTQAGDNGTTWSDRVEFSPSLSSFAAPVGSEVVGRGQTEGEGTNGVGPFRRTAGLNVGNTGDNSGNVNVGYSSRPANTPFTLTFWTNTQAGNQRIFLSDFTFTASTCK